MRLMDVRIPTYPDDLLQYASDIEALSSVADDLAPNSQEKMVKLIASLTISLKNLEPMITRENTFYLGHSCSRLTLNILQVGLLRILFYILTTYFDAVRIYLLKGYEQAASFSRPLRNEFAII